MDAVVDHQTDLYRESQRQIDQSGRNRSCRDNHSGEIDLGYQVCAAHQAIAAVCY
jgi:hypothetical protein